jgi:hypothetical protein
MKKTISVILISVLFASLSHAQKLLDIYKNGPVKLIPDKTYGSGNNWETLFNLYYDTITKNVGKEENKKIIAAPDGSIFMSHKNRHEIWKFGPDGNLIKKIGRKGSKPGQFVMIPTIQPVIENKYFLTSDVGGRLNLFDLNGNFFKTINLKYMGQAFQPIGGGEILLKGFVIWETKTRYIIVRLNINSSKEEIVYDYFIERSKPITVDNVDSLINVHKKNPNFHLTTYFIPENFTFLPGGKFIMSNRNSGELKLMNTNGKEIYKTILDIEQIKITETDVRENYEMMKHNFIETIEAYKKILDPASPMRKHNPDWSPVNSERYLKINQKWLDNVDIYRDIKNYYPYFPIFSHIIPDDEGNLLVFEFTNMDHKDTNIFNVIAYDNNGQKLARTIFICDDYDLNFSESTFVISKGYVYAVAKLKNTSGMPLRLVKLKITN